MSNRVLQKICLSIIFCLYIAAVACICFSKPGVLPQMPASWFGIPADKLGHFLMFLPYPVLAYFIFRTERMGIKGSFAILAIILATGIGFAAGTESIQAHLAYREAEMNDLYADGAGMLLSTAGLIIYIMKRRDR